jgi:hypothetical protein
MLEIFLPLVSEKCWPYEHDLAPEKGSSNARLNKRLGRLKRPFYIELARFYTALIAIITAELRPTDDLAHFSDWQQKYLNMNVT